MTIAYRLPVGMIALVVMALVNSFLLSSVFGGVAGHKIKIPGIDGFDIKDPLYVAANTRSGKNWMGVINFAATDQFISMSMGQVMMIPKTRPLYTRERQNNMYSATAYFLATWLTATLTFIMYPLITSSISFSFLDF